MPQMPGIEAVPYLTNSSIMDVDFLPRHLIIIGGGYIGLEFAQMYRRFGSEVTIIERAPHLARHEDEDVSTAIQEILEQRGHQRSAERNLYRLFEARRGDSRSG